MLEIDLAAIPQAVNNFVLQFQGKNSLELTKMLLFDYWGVLLIFYVFFKYLVFPEYMFHVNGKFFSKNKFIFLAVDVPKLNEQSVQAMENLFDHLQGAHGTITLWDKYIEGVFQLSYAVEIVSIEGNVQFVIRTPSQWRNLVEAAVYGQYPDAEITEVEDYMTNIPNDYPNETHDIWGVEWSLSNPNVYLPIKSWRTFEHNFGESVYVDPMAAMLETMSSIGPGEMLCFQITMTPIEVMWGQEKGKAEIDKIYEKTPKAPKPGFISNMFGQVGSIFNELTEQAAGINLSGGESEEKPQGPMLPNLTPTALFPLPFSLI